MLILKPAVLLACVAHGRSWSRVPRPVASPPSRLSTQPRVHHPRYLARAPRLNLPAGDADHCADLEERVDSRTSIRAAKDEDSPARRDGRLLPVRNERGLSASIREAVAVVLSRDGVTVVTVRNTSTRHARRVPLRAIAGSL